MKIKFQADADFNNNILNSTIRSEPLIDFQTAAVANLEGLGDNEVLALAAKHGRLLVSHDQRTMPKHFSDFILTGISPGVLIVPRKLPYSTVVDELILLWMMAEAEEWANRIAFLPL